MSCFVLYKISNNCYIFPFFYQLFGLILPPPTCFVNKIISQNCQTNTIMELLYSAMEGERTIVCIYLQKSWQGSKKICLTLFTITLDFDRRLYPLRSRAIVFCFTRTEDLLLEDTKTGYNHNYDVCCCYLRKHAWGKGCWPHCGVM